MLANDLGAFVAESRYDALPRQVAEALKLRILDLLAAGLAGHGLGHHASLMPLMEGAGCAAIWGAGTGFAPREAALVNSFTAHSTFLEDGSRHTGGHPSSVVVPGALALAETRRASGRELIAAVAAGYEVFLRLGRAIYPSTVRRGFQSTGVLGAPASAASCASMLRLDARRATHAIAIGCSLGSGLKEALKASRSGALQVARSCEAGVLAAQLAQAGETGAEGIIEDGFVGAFCDDAHLDGVLDGLGSEFRVPETYLKLHAGCRGSHAPVDVVQQMMRANRIVPQDIADISLYVDSVTLAGEVVDPRDAAQARFSIAFAIALALLEGAVSVFDYTEERLHDPRMRAMMGRIRVEADPALDARYPRERGARARITLVDGRCYEGSIGNARGEPENPLDRADIEAKFLGIAARMLGPAAAATIRDLALNLERVDDMRRLTAGLECRAASRAAPPGGEGAAAAHAQPSIQPATGGPP